MAALEPAPVLIVDDDDLVRSVLVSQLERVNIPVIAAASAEEALAKIEVTRLGALVLDLHMPGQSGLVLAEFVRLFGAHLTGVPILIFTGAAVTAETLELARRFGADVYQKPHGLSALIRRLSEVADPVSQLLRMERLCSGSSQIARSPLPGDISEPES